ncbi:chorismate mutase [Candidatus Pristimantibacillus sp. PTI5]|uniref:chorismate mutase n=1 Tax=Candidatus Pristimantibacillus sp. PTI5 TaxID=3400422 RepID=UPI003B02DD6A
MKASKLEELRQNIDHLDKEIISLLAKRFQLTEEVGIYKAAQKLTAQDPGRESQQFEKIAKQAADTDLNPDYASVIYRCVMDLVIARHKEIELSHQTNTPIGQIEAY